MFRSGSNMVVTEFCQVAGGHFKGRVALAAVILGRIDPRRSPDDACLSIRMHMPLRDLISDMTASPIFK